MYVDSFFRYYDTPPEEKLRSTTIEQNASVTCTRPGTVTDALSLPEPKSMYVPPLLPTTQTATLDRRDVRIAPSSFPVQVACVKTSVPQIVIKRARARAAT